MGYKLSEENLRRLDVCPQNAITEFHEIDSILQGLDPEKEEGGIIELFLRNYKKLQEIREKHGGRAYEDAVKEIRQHDLNEPIGPHSTMEKLSECLNVALNLVQEINEHSMRETKNRR